MLFFFFSETRWLCLKMGVYPQMDPNGQFLMRLMSNHRIFRGSRFSQTKPFICTIKRIEFSESSFAVRFATSNRSLGRQLSNLLGDITGYPTDKLPSLTVDKPSCTRRGFLGFGITIRWFPFPDWAPPIFIILILGVSTK